MNITPDTVPACDRAIMSVHEAHLDAEEHGNKTLAAEMLIRENELLELRPTLPRQR